MNPIDAFLEKVEEKYPTAMDMPMFILCIWIMIMPLLLVYGYINYFILKK
jgi:hypothetical protein